MEHLKPINHYSLENPASVFDEEAMTALQLAGRTAAKCNETVRHVNKFTDRITEQQRDFENDISKQQGTFEGSVNERLEQMEEKVDEIPQRVEDAAREQIASGALDHVVQENIEVLGTELDVLVNTSTNANNASLEITAARVGNGRVVYPTLGDAIRGQTTNIKPERLNPSGAEWKGDSPAVPVIAEQGMKVNLSGFSGGFEFDSNFILYAYSVNPGEEYLYTAGVEFSEATIKSGAIFFGDGAGNMDSIIGGTNLDKFIKCVDSTNWVYRIHIPMGCKNLFFNHNVSYPVHELWKVSTTQALDWLRVKEGNIVPGAVTPANICRKGGTWYRDVEYTRTMHAYKGSNGNEITDYQMGGMCLCTIPEVQPGEVYRLPIGKDVSGQMGNYFVFETADGLPAVRDIASCVELVNGDSYIYHVTIPSGCVKFHTACDSADQLNIQEVCTRVSLPWLKVTAANLDENMDLGNGRTNLDYIWSKPNWNGKKVLCIGDSITAGIYSDTSGTSVTAFGSPIQRFCDSVGATLVNKSVSGSGFSEWWNGTPGGDSLSNILFNNAPDVVIVALGVNDFRSEDADHSTRFVLHCTGVLNTVKEYLYNNPGAVGIAITPLDCDMKKNAHGYTLEHFRKTIMQLCIAHSASVDNDPGTNAAYGEMMCVDGGALPVKEFGMLPDGLHPSMRGQHMFAQWLRMKLT